MSIEDAIKQLEQDLELDRSSASPLGYFRAMWTRVLRRIPDGEWDSADRATELCLGATNRFLAAHDAYASGEPLVRSWKLAFDSANVAELRQDLLILQQLLLSVNAMVGFSLPLTMADMCDDPAALNGLKNDFTGFAKLVFAELDGARDAIAPFSPLIDTLPAAGAQDGDNTLCFSTGTAHRMAWRIAGLLLTQGSARMSVIDHYDRVVEAQSRRIREPEHLGVPLGFIRRFEADREDETAVARIIDAMVGTP